MRSTFFPPAAWGTHQIVILYILSISILFFHFPYCISTVRADSFLRSHGGNTTRYTSNFTYTYLIFNFLYLSPMRLTSFLQPHGEHIKLLSFISYRYHLFFIFLIVFLPCERIPFPVRTVEIPQGIHLILPIPTLFFNSPYLSPMRLTSFLRPHGEHIKLLTSISNSLI